MHLEMLETKLEEGIIAGCLQVQPVSQAQPKSSEMPSVFSTPCREVQRCSVSEERFCTKLFLDKILTLVLRQMS